MAAVALALIPLSAFGFVQSPSGDSADARFHRAEILLGRGALPEAIEAYTSVIEGTQFLDNDVREWYAGNSYFGIALAEALRGDSTATRVNLDRALHHEYWVLGALSTNPALVTALGRTVVDSLCVAWENVRAQHRNRWLPVDPIVVRPQDTTTPTSRVIIYFHGGYANLEISSWRWRRAADSLHAIVIIPAGPDRVSDVGFSWDTDFWTAESAVLAVLQRPDVRMVLGDRKPILAGFSQGGHIALEFALHHPEIVQDAFVVEGFVGDALDHATLSRARDAGTRIYGVFGEEGFLPFRTSFEELMKRCEQSGVKTHIEFEKNMAHEVPSDLSGVLAGAMRWFDGGN